MKAYILLIAVAVAAAAAAAGQLSPSQCSAQKNDMVNRCRNVVLPGILGGKPSAACCQLIRAADLECACKFVSPELVAALGGARRAVALVQGCGRAVPSNFKCGSLTTPR